MKTKNYSTSLQTPISSEAGFIKVMVCGSSMKPFFHAGDMVAVGPAAPETVKKGSIILFSTEGGAGLWVMHRVKRIVSENGTRRFLCQGDNRFKPDGYIDEQQVIGKVIGRCHKDRLKPVRRTHEYGGLILSGWYRGIKFIMKHAALAVWPFVSRWLVHKIYVNDQHGRARELVFLGWGRFRFVCRSQWLLSTRPLPNKKGLQ